MEEKKKERAYWAEKKRAAKERAEEQARVQAHAERLKQIEEKEKGKAERKFGTKKGADKELKRLNAQYGR